VGPVAVCNEEVELLWVPSILNEDVWNLRVLAF
jgi:hypothetical protein